MQITTQTIDEVLYPKIEAHTTGFLEVSNLHTIAWERSGNPDGIPVIVIHGGPGGGSQPSYRRYFDPKKFDIIQFDQRVRKIHAICRAEGQQYTSLSLRFRDAERTFWNRKMARFWRFLGVNSISDLRSKSPFTCSQSDTKRDFHVSKK